ncbi:shieldin complex subunit 1 isoform X3 [Herpailurus yagouaroundi]|uniref:shieldin complex subunit 1 isoform X3 n=1 Tax=Herpailurus yagouaroundi TaxID=1608482 RepID=UPI001AD63777|nr:shieldin complex subunit 1 isoform X3 [Puma yagouaroundi]
MATQEATPGSQSEESSALDLPTVYDIRDYVLQRPHQEADSEAFSSVEALSSPCSSDADPGPRTEGTTQTQSVFCSPTHQKKVTRTWCISACNLATRRGLGRLISPQY